MIEFCSNYKYNYSAYEEKTKEQYKDICSRVSTVLEGDINNKILLGELLKELWESKSYAFRCQDAHDYDGKWYADKNAVAGVYFYVCEVEFGLERSEVSRLVNVAAEFGHEGKVRVPYRGFKYSALVELLSIDYWNRHEVQADWTIKQIREYKKKLKEEKIDFDAADKLIENVMRNNLESDSCLDLDISSSTDDYIEQDKLEYLSTDELVKRCRDLQQKLSEAYDRIAELEQKIEDFQELDEYTDTLLVKDYLDEAS